MTLILHNEGYDPSLCSGQFDICVTLTARFIQLFPDIGQCSFILDENAEAYIIARSDHLIK